MPNERHASSPRGSTVLAVDPGEEVHGLLRARLDGQRFAGATVRTLSAHSAREARALLRAHHRDIGAVIVAGAAPWQRVASVGHAGTILRRHRVGIELNPAPGDGRSNRPTLYLRELGRARGRADRWRSALLVWIVAVLRAPAGPGTAAVRRGPGRREDPMADGFPDAHLELIGVLTRSRSRETVAHVKRVALVAELLARASGLDPLTAETLRLAAPLHDIGKLAVPDAILCKRGPHTPAEAAIMRSHADAGAQLLRQSGSPLLQFAADIAASHHENWDGTGYPHGLSGERIPLPGRIVAIADVCDALGSRRCYKEAWPEEAVRAHFHAQRGRKFDPRLVDLLLAHWPQVAQLRALWPD